MKAQAGLKPANCGDTPGEQVWIHTSTGKTGGRRSCWIDTENRFVVAWTHEKLGSDDHVDTLGVAREPGRAPTTFASWWNSVNDFLGKCRQQIAEHTCIATIKALTFDVFGTVVDWRSSLIREGEALGRERHLAVDWAKFADAWRGLYQPNLERVRSGAVGWTKLDDLHRAALDRLLVDFGITGLGEADIDHLNRAWHRLDPWPDAVPGLTRWTLLHEPLYVLMRRGHRFCLEPEVSLEAFRDDRFVVPGKDLNTGFNRRLAVMCRESGFEPRTVPAGFIWDDGEWPPGQDVIALATERVARNAPCEPARGDCLLLFGKHAPRGEVDREFDERLDRAAALWRTHPPRRLVLLGGGPPGVPSEAEVARERVVGDVERKDKERQAAQVSESRRDDVDRSI